MKTRLLTALAVLLLLGTACKKLSLTENLSTSAAADPQGFVSYLIPKGAHYANGNALHAIDLTELRFFVRFDSSCIYTTATTENQWDINKLYGFSDNGALHQQYSARFGWRWSEGALRLFAYTYNAGIREAKELAEIPIGPVVHCSIKIMDGAYVFSVEGKSETMPRQSTTPTAKGYRLYPYFGGDETAPHAVRIWIREE